MVEYLRCLRRRFSALILSLIPLAIPFGVQAQDQIVVGYDGHAGFQGPIWATKDLGLLDKYGVPGELVLIPGSARFRYRTAGGLFARRRCGCGGCRVEQVSLQCGRQKRLA